MRTATTLTAISMALALGACNSDKGVVIDDTGEITDSGASDGGDGGDGGSGDTQSPTILSVDAWCYLHSTGDKAYFWTTKVEAADPQGTETLERFVPDGISVALTGGAELATYALVCDDSGDCQGSWNQNQDGISCENATNYTVSFTAMDEDGNLSAPVSVAGRRGTSAEG
jgi:hypothetical protein